MTLREVMIALGVMAVAIAVVLLSVVNLDPKGCGASRWFINGHQLFMAGYHMAMDRNQAAENENPAMGWPGELAALEGEGRIETVKQYVDRLMELDYLRPEDVRKIMGGLGHPLWDATAGTFSGDKHSSFKIYRSTREDSPSGLFAVTRNFTYGKELDSTQLPLAKNADRFFVVIRMGGDGAEFNSTRVHSHSIGLLPGRREWREGDVEVPADSLLQR